MTKEALRPQPSEDSEGNIWSPLDTGITPLGGDGTALSEFQVESIVVDPNRIIRADSNGDCDDDKKDGDKSPVVGTCWLPRCIG